MRRALQEHAKTFLNAAANRRLGQLGYSDGRIRDAKREAWWWALARADSLRRAAPLLSGRAVVWTDSGRAELLPVDVAAAGRGEVTVRIETSAVSPGTERAQYLRLPNATISFPHRPGYSAAGTAVAVGRGVTHVRVGQPVAVVAPHASVVTVPGARVFALPPKVDFSSGAFLQLGIICSHGVRMGRIEGGERVAVVGAGIIGLLSQRLALADGCTDIVVIARSRAKERIARAGGAAAFLAVDEGDAVADVGADVVIEATGDPAAVVTALEAARPGGRVVLLGSPRGTTLLPAGALRERGVMLVGAHVETLSRRDGSSAHRREGDRFLSLLADGRLPVDDLVQRQIDPREADSFYRELGKDSGLVGARFQWSLLPDADRIVRGRVLRLPSITGRGVDSRERPLVVSYEQLGSEVTARRPRSSTTRRLGIAVVGCGDIGFHNAAAVVSAPNAELTACFDANLDLAKNLAQQHQVKTAETFDDLLAHPDADAVFIAVPHHLHADLAIRAAEAGKHVIVEKPLANDLRGALAVAAVAQRTDVAIAVCFPHRYEGDVEIARRQVAEGAVGQLGGALVNFYSEKPPSYWHGGFSGRSTSSWRASREQAGGGVLIMNLSHVIDLLRYIGGVEIEACFARTAVVDGPSEVEDSISATIRFANGALGTLFGSSALRGHRGATDELNFWGPDGYLAVRPSLRIYTSRALDGLRTTRWQQIVDVPEVDIRATFVARFAEAVSEGRTPDVTVEDGVAVQAFIEACYRSSELGAEVRLAEVLTEAGG